jgi:hypothetical protein
LANGTFKDAKISRLESPAPDARRLANLLIRKDVGGYSVTLCIDPDFATARIEVQKFFEGASHDDMNLVLISGHGIKDRWGKLHFASADTDMGVLRASSLASRYVIECMDESDAAQQILFIDTCYSGAFAKGMVNKAAMVSVSRDDFGDVDAKGKAIITASTSVQLAGEGKADGTVQSVFTRHLIEGIESGAADNGGTGEVRLNELYNYVRSSLKREAPNQTPQPFYYGLDGSSVVVALNPSPKMAELPQELRRRIESADYTIQGAAVDDLYKLAASGGAMRATAAAELKKLQTGDSIFVQGLADRALGRLGVQNARNEKAENIVEKQKRTREEALVYLKDHVGEDADINQMPREIEYEEKTLFAIFKPLIFMIIFIAVMLVGFELYKNWETAQAAKSANAENAAVTEMNAADAMEGTTNDAMTNVDGAMGADASTAVRKDPSVSKEEMDVLLKNLTEVGRRAEAEAALKGAANRNKETTGSAVDDAANAMKK